MPPSANICQGEWWLLVTNRSGFLQIPGVLSREGRMVFRYDSRSLGPIGLWLDMWGSNPCPIIPYAIVPHEGFEPLTQDSMSNPLTNCTTLGPLPPVS